MIDDRIGRWRDAVALICWVRFIFGIEVRPYLAPLFANSRNERFPTVGRYLRRFFDPGNVDAFERLDLVDICMQTFEDKLGPCVTGYFVILYVEPLRQAEHAYLIAEQAMARFSDRLLKLTAAQHAHAPRNRCEYQNTRDA